MEKTIYQTPLVEVQNFKVEQGFATSNAGGNAPDDMWDNMDF